MFNSSASPAGTPEIHGQASNVTRRSVVTLPGLMVLVALTLSGCMGGWMGPMNPGMHGPAGPSRAQAPSSQPGAPELVVVATDFAFSPNELRISAGEVVNLTLDNRGRLYHDLTINGLGFVLAAESGELATGALMVPQPGRYEYECSVPGHAGAGMTGSLVVE